MRHPRIIIASDRPGQVTGQGFQNFFVATPELVPIAALLLTDPKDTLVPVGTARRLAEALPDARLQLVEGVGHHLPRRAHAAVADAVTAFLAAVDSSSSLR